MVTSEAEDGNITTNCPANPKAATAPPEAGGIENQESQASIFDAVATIQPGRVMLTPDDSMDLLACGLETDNNNQPVLENADPPDELEDVQEWIKPEICH